MPCPHSIPQFDPCRRGVPSPRQDRLGHRLQAVYVVGLEPLQHYTFHPGLVQPRELLRDLKSCADDGAPGAELIRGLARELALDVGGDAPEYSPRHKRAAYLLQWAAGLSQ